jgi:hypothetical protein
MRLGLFGAVRVLWLLAASSILLLTLLLLGRQGQEDADILFVYLMIGLGFPASLLVLALAGGILFLVQQTGPDPIQTSRVMILLLWSGFVAVGYGQWFVAVPVLARHVRRRFGGRQPQGLTDGTGKTPDRIT